MRVLFCHNGPLRMDKQGNYYGVAHNDEMFKRYYAIAENLSMITRIARVSEKETTGLSKITVKPFSVIECPNTASLKGQLFERRKAERIIEKAVQNTDYVVARNSRIALIAIKYAKKYNKPYLLEVVACPWDAMWNHSLKGKILAPFSYLSLKRVAKNSQYVVYVTNDFLQRRYPTKGKSTNCSNVALTEFDDKVLERRLEKIESMDESSKVIIGTTAAVNVRYKGQQYVIKALGKMKRQGITNFEYQLVGGGDQSYLRKIAEKHDVVDQVKFLGPMPHSNVFEWLETIDVYAQPSRQEGLPRALIEAMSRAVPAFGAKTAGIPELLESDFIFSNTKRNIEEICQILNSFDEDTLLAQAKRNYEEAKKYDKEIIEKRRRDFFEGFRDSYRGNNL